ncbi:MAG: response regulator transcription factor [Anaerolineae bacterium]|nr:response regulator transcription factor [Anaerolineae bacterium]MCX8067017.1 response regulator transcription factor [Anaerolineae bacterium]MDW7991255.1 response regulator transcription factor [Anaerolineae bacterium]
MGGTRVLIVDDHPFFREGLRQVIAAEEDLEVVGEAGDGEEALAMVRECSPDVVVMDVNLPKINGLEATQRIKDTFPDVQVVILTAYDDEEQVYHAVRFGASAYHAKDVEPHQLIRTIRLVRSGAYVVRNRVLNREQLAEWLQERYRQFGGELIPEKFLPSPLSAREMEVLRLMVAGLTNKEIAYRLGISHQTVKNHVTAILSKLGVADRTQATVYALRHGWVPLRPPESSR